MTLGGNPVTLTCLAWCNWAEVLCLYCFLILDWLYFWILSLRSEAHIDMCLPTWI